MSEQITVCIADNDEDYRRWLERELNGAGDIRIAASVSVDCAGLSVPLTSVRAIGTSSARETALQSSSA